MRRSGKKIGFRTVLAWYRLLITHYARMRLLTRKTGIACSCPVDAPNDESIASRYPKCSHKICFKAICDMLALCLRQVDRCQRTLYDLRRHQLPRDWRQKRGMVFDRIDMCVNRGFESSSDVREWSTNNVNRSVTDTCAACKMRVEADFTYRTFLHRKVGM